MDRGNGPPVEKTHSREKSLNNAGPPLPPPKKSVQSKHKGGQQAAEIGNQVVYYLDTAYLFLAKT